MANYRQEVFIRREETLNWEDFLPFDEMKDALAPAVDSIQKGRVMCNTFWCRFSHYFEDDAEFLHDSHRNENSDRRQETLATLSAVRRRIQKILDDTQMHFRQMQKLADDIEEYCEYCDVLPEKLAIVATLRVEDQKLNDEITNLILDLHNIYRFLFKLDARQEIIRGLKHVMDYFGTAFAHLEYSTYCARAHLVGMTTLQVVSEGIDALTKRLVSL